MKESNGFLRSILKSSGQFCMVAFASLFLVSFLSACNSNSESANNGTASSGANSFVSAKVAIPKGLTFTNEMLDFAKLEEGSDPKNYFKTKEELFNRIAKDDIGEGKLISKDDTEKKEAEEEEDDDDEKKAQSKDEQVEKDSSDHQDKDD